MQKQHQVYGRELETLKSEDGCGEGCEKVLVAALAREDISDDLLTQLQHQRDIVVHTQARLQFHGQPRRLFILHLASSAPHSETPAALQLEQLCGYVDDWLHGLRPDGCCHAGPTTWMWPLHDPISWRLELAKEEVLGRHSGDGSMQQLLQWLHMRAPVGGHPFVLKMRDRYGAAAAYSFAYAHLFIQRLWPVTLLCVAFMAIGAGPHEGSRVLWELFKLAILLWGVLFLDDDEAAILAPSPCSASFDQQRSLGNPAYHPGKRIWPRLLLQAAPAMLGFFALVFGVLLMQVEFNAWLVFIWGDCVHLLCMDPIRKHGFVGWLGQVGSDITVAILFELLKEMAKAIGSWVASLQNHQRQLDHDRAMLVVSVGLESCAKVGAFAILAFTFVPQWTPLSGTAGPGKECSDYWGYKLLGDSSLLCLQRQLEPRQRQQLFELAMTGPFVVAPFIEILMKAIVPKIAERLYGWEHSKGTCTTCCGRAGDFLARFLATIFVYDCESIGCLRFAFGGWPYCDIKVEHTASRGVEACRDGSEEEDARDLVQRALEQHVLRPFKPLEELLELKLGFLCILFFAPCKPMIAVPFLIARLLECHTDLAKLLFVDRRGRPCSTTYMLHEAQRRFIATAVTVSFVWSLGLSLVTYNPYLAEWLSWAGD